jgi:hypothetical protein
MQPELEMSLLIYIYIYIYIYKEIYSSKLVKSKQIWPAVVLPTVGFRSANHATILYP